jgi:O-antigen ligase/polysaccharide polymerase Wzy-like membrane protein
MSNQLNLDRTRPDRRITAHRPVEVAGESRFGWPGLGLVVLLCSLALYPKSFSGDPDLRHVGIAQSVPAVATYTVVLLGIAYILLLRTLHHPTARGTPASVLVFVGFLVVGLSVIWQGTGEQLAGALQLGLGFCAWFVGARLGPPILAQERRVRWIANTIAGIVGIETLVALLQRIGVAINPMSAANAALLGDRVNGTTNHPDNLGKLLLLLLILCLGLMGTSNDRTRRTLWLSVVLMFIPLGLSQGRANLLAALTAILFWALLSGRRRSLAVRLGIPLAAILVVLPFASTIATRIQEDPNGGPRAGLAAAALAQIDRQPWGIGPNAYVSVVSKYDAVTASGYPVHNTFLLTAAELGVLGALLFWLPVAGLVTMAWISRERPGFAGSFALAIVASAPGLYVVNATGWAILRGPLLPLWFLVCGIAYSQLGTADWARLIRRSRRGATQSTAPSSLGHATVPAYAAHGQVSIRPPWPRTTRW